MILGGGLLDADRQAADLPELRYPLPADDDLHAVRALIGPQTEPRCTILIHVTDIATAPWSAALVLPLFASCSVRRLRRRGDRRNADARASQVEYVNFEEGDDGYRVTVPLRVYDSGPGRRARRSVESPWGETHDAEPLSPLKPVRL